MEHGSPGGQHSVGFAKPGEGQLVGLARLGGAEEVAEDPDCAAEPAGGDPNAPDCESGPVQVPIGGTNGKGLGTVKLHCFAVDLVQAVTGPVTMVRDHAGLLQVHHEGSAPAGDMGRDDGTVQCRGQGAPWLLSFQNPGA